MFFDKVLQHHKIGLLFSTILLLVAFAIVGHSYATTGEVVSKGIDFTGGSQIAIIVDDLQAKAEIEQDLNTFGQDITVRFVDSENLILAESKEELSAKNVQDIIEKRTNVIDISSQQLGASLGQQFLRDAYVGLFIGFVGMSLIVFLTFRTFVPSMAVILAGASDIVIAVACMNIFNVDLTLMTLVGLLTLIGFSVDTDILLSTRVLKRRSIGTLHERITDSFKTGITMTLAAIASMVVLLLVSTSPALDSIATVILFGLIADIPITWLQNTAILKIYCQKKGIV